jgi:acyl-CoA dehydrogenase
MGSLIAVVFVGDGCELNCIFWQAGRALMQRTPKHKVQSRAFITPAYNLAKRVMPKISDTERAALDSGTVAFDRDLFTGDPKLSDIVKKYKVSLTAEELSFLQNETEVLCEMLDNHQIDKDQNLPPKVLNFASER